jgi:glutamate decarboxylase
MLCGWRLAGRDAPYPHVPYAQLLTQLSDTRLPAHGMP